ncbi:MAG: hypothetical protein ACYC2H_04890 [Thermoplasmatota archaeon]
MNQGRSIWAIAAAVACLAAVAVAATLPWMSTSDEAGGGDLGIRDLATSALGYERFLAWAPLIGLPLAAVALVMAAVKPGQRALWVWGVVASASVPPAVAAMRLLGFQIARLLDDGPSLVWLGPAPYAVLAAAAAALALAATALWPSRKTAPAGTLWLAWASIACVATLALLPLFPFGKAGATGGVHLDELTLALAAAGSADGGVAEAARTLAWGRTALWAAAVFAGLATAAAVMGTPSLRWTAWLPVPALLAAAVLAGRFEWQWLRVAGVQAEINHVLPVGVLAAAALQVRALAWRAQPGRALPLQGSVK